MKKQSLIIDCDPGVDDALGLFLAFGSPGLELLAVTTVGGNVPGDITARNARIMRQLAGREDVPVHAGADRPLVREPVAAAEFHGEGGIGDMTPFEPRVGNAPGPAAQAIVDLVMARPAGSVALAIMGPMTNLALAMRLEPKLAAHLGPVSVMGGARSEGGNITASAEFNIYADPDAAAEVFASDCDITVFGLDVTHQVRVSEDRIVAIEVLGGESARTAGELLRFSQRVEREIVGWDAGPLHDPCTVAWLLDRDLFGLKPCRIEVETVSDLTRGHTAVEFRVDAATARHHWAVSVDAGGVFARINASLERLP
ncbi:nucleoside hydrolase [uncultured Brevundimonas sp.]|uniref:nucleoside hydrolase n=1 Tax=uncultured Brevundimonas sp. TaxID=213418 RepID=UPI0030ED8F2D